MKARTLAAYATVAAIGLAGGYLAWQQLGGPPAPAPAATPAFDREAFFRTKMADLEGREQAFAQWRGKVLVVNFWAAWCPPCREEMPMFVQVQDALRDKGVVFLGIALDQKDKVAAFADEIGVNYPVLLGGIPGMDMMKQAGNRLGSLPYTFILDREGNPVAAATGALQRERLEAAVKPLI